MKIGGLQKVSLLEYPGQICAIVFSQGCNFRCPYCHNPELVDPDLYGQCLAEEEFFSFLNKRKGKLDAVTITGGEPTIQADLLSFIRHIKKMGHLIKIDTNGSHPEVLTKLIEGKLVNYIAMDIKGPLEKYGIITGTQIHQCLIKESIEMIMHSGIEYEFRTTVVRSQLTKNDLFHCGKLIKNARLYVLQPFIPSKTLDREFLAETTYSYEEFKDIKKKLEKHISRVAIR
ncbi:MAG: anaerobic ribonucleoside-triphosphate reductase activating protein [Syntrophales bacterium]|nr:anaerobic ribonucleoside-triphosphate reductase activating protein [Syntrophales bacterium]